MRLHLTDLQPVTVTSREVTPEGFLRAPAKIARSGIQLYTAGELGLPGVDAKRIIKLYRAPEEVFNPATMKSFESQTVVNNHPKEGFVSSRNWKQLAIGDVRDIVRSGNFLAANLIIKDEQGKNAVVGGKLQLSCGYDFDLDMTPGRTPEGEEYDGCQKNISGNHLALVDAGRAGWEVRVGDSNEMENNTMKKPRGRDAMILRMANAGKLPPRPSKKQKEADAVRPRGRDAMLANSRKNGERAAARRAKPVHREVDL